MYTNQSLWKYSKWIIWVLRRRRKKRDERESARCTSVHVNVCVHMCVSVWIRSHPAVSDPLYPSLRAGWCTKLPCLWPPLVTRARTGVAGLTHSLQGSSLYAKHTLPCPCARTHIHVLVQNFDLPAEIVGEFLTRWDVGAEFQNQTGNQVSYAELRRLMVTLIYEDWGRNETMKWQKCHFFLRSSKWFNWTLLNSIYALWPQTLTAIGRNDLWSILHRAIWLTVCVLARDRKRRKSDTVVCRGDCGEVIRKEDRVVVF